MNFNKKLAVAVSGAVLLMAGQVALADSATDIVDALVSKGVLTEEEGKLISKGHKSKTSVTPVVKEKDGAFILESANARNSIQLTGRMHLDYRDIDNTDLTKNNAGDIDKDGASGASQYELRRARLGVKGKFAKYFNYEVVGNLPGTATIDVAFLDFARYDQAQLRVGKFKQPFGLEQLTSSNNIDFLERSFVDQTVPGKKIGAMLFGELRPGLTYAGSVYQMNDVELNAKSEDMSYAGRGTLNFAELMGNKDAIFHVGLAGMNNSWSVRPTASSSSSGSNTTAGTLLSYRTPGRGLSNMFRAQSRGDDVGGSHTHTATTTTTTTTVPANDVNGVTPGSLGWIPTYTSTSTSATTNASATDRVANGISDATVAMESRAYGLEGIAALNSFKVQGEYTRGDYKSNYLDGTARVELDNKAFYGEALWLITGEKYSSAYKKGAFSSIKPNKEFDLDNFSGLGAWELGLRYEEFEVSDGVSSGTSPGSGTRWQGSVNCNGTSSGSAAANSSQTGAKTNCQAGARTVTAGLKWILNPNVLVKAAYSRTTFGDAWTHYDIGSSGANGNMMKHEDIFAVRGQFTF